VYADISYVTFSKASEAALAIEEMNGKCMFDNPRPVKVNSAGLIILSIVALFNLSVLHLFLPAMHGISCQISVCVYLSQVGFLLKWLDRPS